MARRCVRWSAPTSGLACAGSAGSPGPAHGSAAAPFPTGSDDSLAHVVFVDLGAILHWLLAGRRPHVRLRTRADPPSPLPPYPSDLLCPLSPGRARRRRPSRPRPVDLAG